MAKPANIKCINCDFFQRGEAGSDIGWCCYYPPVAAGFPRCSPHDFCAHHSAWILMPATTRQLPLPTDSEENNG